MSMGPIPFTSVDRFASRYGIGADDVDEFNEFLTVIRAMDAVRLRQMAPGPATPGVRGEVSLDDVEGVRSLLSGLAKAPEQSHG